MTSEAHRLARDIRKRIENELDYPGHIKVTVIRETRAVEYANKVVKHRLYFFVLELDK